MTRRKTVRARMINRGALRGVDSAPELRHCSVRGFPDYHNGARSNIHKIEKTLDIAYGSRSVPNVWTGGNCLFTVHNEGPMSRNV